MYDFLSGMITAGFLVAALFFLRFWRRTGDWLFAIFGVSFVLFAANHMAILIANVPREEQSLFYLLRLAGFVLIIVAIIVKNFPRASSR